MSRRAGAGEPAQRAPARGLPDAPEPAHGPAVGSWEFRLPTAAATQALAERLGRLLRAGDMLVLSGGLGAGKTTFTQGLGRGLGVRPGIISPTFVLVRIHPNQPDGPNPGGPDLVHADAYRLGSAGEVDDIDLENTLDTAVTVVEWGSGRVEHLAESRLEVELRRATGGGARPDGEGARNFHPQDGWFGDGLPDADSEEDDDEPRVLRIRALGPRWLGTDLSVLAETVE
ncbi:MAG: tRNA (adenosine(37)-N6)-threonylcarbamoyltransferase complex ATPase subunit type 1 TsaE [Actinomycetota bacterium]|nr:tRNA (adenosine(37)-N6)-threonylcarbamoyltransferase complex ATPase subunit type 1 TsaE [Actinomycetota bacterium]